VRELLSITSGDAELALSVLGGGGEGEDGDEGEDEDDDADLDLQRPTPSLHPNTGEVRSLVQLHGTHDSTCGYCHASSNGRRCFGLTSSSMRCSDYEEMLNRGWRRSGDYFYKPDNA